jgi:hypothetical protein
MSETWKAPFGIRYAPTPKQLEAHLSDKVVRVLAGGYGSGKTTCLLVEILKQIESHGARHVAVICDYSVHCQSMIEGLYSLYRSENQRALISTLPFQVAIGFQVGDDSVEQIATYERATITFSAGARDLRGQQFDFVGVQTANGDISALLARAPRAKRIMIDFNPGDRLRGDYLNGDLQIFNMGVSVREFVFPSGARISVGTDSEPQQKLQSKDANCLCCPNPPSVEYPGLAAIEATIRQAKARELGDAASDPFEMEGGDAMENR